LAQDDYFYEIQLSNKQLVFYFMALATGLIMSFLAGIMVGRGVDDRAEPAANRPLQEERVVAEEKSRVAPPTPTSLTYAQRLEGEKTEEALEKPRPQATAAVTSAVRAAADAKAAKPSPRPERAAGTEAGTPAAKASPAVAATKSPEPPPRTSPPPTVTPPAVAPATGFAIQVGAFRDRAAADSIVARLKGKGFGAYAVAPAAADGLFNVRVGPFTQRADAEKAQAKLRDEEKLKPFIVKQ
jgi:cell division septation protein DedD